MKKIIALLLTMVMLFSLAACAGEGNTETTNAPEVNNPTDAPDVTEGPKEPVTITIYPLNANLTSGPVGGWLGDYLLENGFILEVLSFSDEKLNAMLAAGTLPDLVYLPNTADIKELTNNGTLVDLAPYIDQLPNLANSEKYTVAMDYVKNYVTDGKLSVLPLQVGATANPVNTERSAVKLNYALYNELGCPEFSNIDELIDVLKQMQAAYPTHEDGTKMYAMHLFNSMDTNYFYGIYNIFAITGYSTEFLKFFVETDSIEEEFGYILDDDSNYKYSLSVLNKFYREGLLDPDSITTDRGTQNTRIEAGYALAGWAGVPGWEAKGYYPVHYAGVETYYNTAGNAYGVVNQYLAVSANAEKNGNLDGVLSFLNFIADPDVQRVFGCGPEGEMWELDAEGKAVLTEKGEGWWVNGQEALIGDEPYALFNTALFWGSCEPASDGLQIDVSKTDAAMNAKADTDLNRLWQENTGYVNYLEQIEDLGTVVLNPFQNDLAKFVGTPSDEQNLIIGAAKEIIVNASWQMVYAESDEAFEQIWAKAVADCEALGIRDIYEWQIEQLTNAQAIKAELAN